MTTANLPQPAAGLRLRSLTIENYKKIDKLELEFPQPLMAGDMDVLVLGSKNGGGKTSVLECCSLLLFSLLSREAIDSGVITFPNKPERPQTENMGQHFKKRFFWPDIASFAIKAGCDTAIVQGSFEKENKSVFVFMEIHRRGQVIVSINAHKDIERLSLQCADWTSDAAATILRNVFAWSGDAVISPYLMHFNSYRRVYKSNPQIGMMLDERFVDWKSSEPISSFKIEVLRLLMGRASLFEGFDKTRADIALAQLNSLVERYCGGSIESLSPAPDNTLDIRIRHRNGGQSFSFDGLSSGQKEMIATLFLIWKNTHNQSAIVLIDEPELHLNTEWHGDFIHQLHKLAPHNQYILATHSEEIFRSVDESRRAILLPDVAGDAQ